MGGSGGVIDITPNVEKESTKKYSVLSVVSVMVPFCKRKTCFLQKTNMFIEYIMYCNDKYSIVKIRPLYTSCF